MNRTLLQQSIYTQAVLRYARSSGPGGQNVNKVNTKVFIKIPLNQIEGLGERERQQVTHKLSSRIDNDGCISLSVEDERSRIRNEELAFHRLISLISAAAILPKKRIPTKPTKSARLKRLQVKQHVKAIKNNRTWKQDLHDS